jgi:hypothetical protein
MINLNKNTSHKKILSFQALFTANSKAGFTLFVAMIVSSLLLAVGFSIGNIILKQLILSGSGKDSQIAFYAADSGAECVQFWDTKNADGTPVEESPFSASSTEIIANKVKCGSGNVAASKVTGTNDATSTLIVDFSGSESYKACALVLIEKGFTEVLGEDIPYTRITSRGYNAGKTMVAGAAACDTSNQRTVERGLYVQY